MKTYLEVAQEAARTAGRYLMEQFGKLDAEHITEKGRNDFVTTVDFEAEKIISDIINKNFPTHSILGEESGLADQKSDFLWIVDPLDGTKNFIHSIPVFGVSIALMQEGKVIVGVVNHPSTGQLFWAESGKGAFVNGTPIQVSHHNQMTNSILATGFPHRNKPYILRYMKIFEQLFLKASDMRRLGAACIDLAYVACGKMDGFFEFGLNIWDLAAGDLLVREAGGRVTDFWGENNHLSSGFIIASTPKIHKEITNVTTDYFPYPIFKK